MFSLITKLKFGLVLALITIFAGTNLFAEAAGVKSGNKKDNSLRNAIKSTRGYSRFNKTQLEDQGNVRYLRSTTVDGNLVTGSITNNGVLSSTGGSTMRLSWPKGPKLVDYIYGAFFYVAAEVVDANGDTIAIVSDYFSLSGAETSPDQSHTYHFMPLPGYFNLDEPDALSTPLVYGISEDVGKDGIPNTFDEGEGDGELQLIEDFNNNGILDLSMQNVVGWFATTSQKQTWPEYWPAGSYKGDTRQPGDQFPGVRAARWNGEFGAYVRGDQESYYVMNDYENDEFAYYPFTAPEDSLPWPNGRRGLGVEVKARTYQWNARLAEDLLINIYDITNDGKNLEKCVVGMLVDPDMGGQFYNDNADFDTLSDITYTWNQAGRDLDTGLPIGYFGFAFLESPGLAFDGRDNDSDGMIDESQENGIDDDGDWTPWEDLNGNGTFDNEDINFNLVLDEGEDANGNGSLDIEPIHDDTGEDGLGPEDFEYSGPDQGEADGIPGHNEPNFETTDNDESDQVGLTSAYFKPHSGHMDDDQIYWDEQLQPGTFDRTSDWQTDVAFTYGSGFVRFADGERTQRYAIALAFGNDFPDILRNKRTMQVIYDNDYNFAKAPLQPTLSSVAADGAAYLSWDDIAERSTDPIYGKDFEAYYVYKSTDPTFDEIKTITDAFGNPLLFKPLKIYDKINGLKGLHPIRLGSELGSGSDLGVTYNMGDDTGLSHFFKDTDVINGRTYYYAVASLDQGYDITFYDDSISQKPNLNPIAPTECPVNIQIDPLGRPVAYDRNTAAIVPTENTAGYVLPTHAGMDHVSGRGTGGITVDVYNPLAIKTGHRYRVEFSDDAAFEPRDPGVYTGFLNGIKVYSITDNEELLSVSKPQNDDIDEKYILEESFRISLQNDSTSVDHDSTGWVGGTSNLQIVNLDQGNSWYKRDYEIRVLGEGADTTRRNIPVNFQFWDVTDPDSAFQHDWFMLVNSENNPGYLDEGIQLRVWTNHNPRKVFLQGNWEYSDTLNKILPQEGDVYKIKTRKGFDRHDAFEFTFKGNIISDNKAKNDLDQIYTVPDPYISVNRLERKVINPEEGRGGRRIDFVNVPKKCTISIYTASGRLVQTLEFESTDKDRRAHWDLRTKDGLEIASGMYFYAVDAPGIGVKTGKFAVIK